MDCLHSAMIWFSCYNNSKICVRVSVSPAMKACVNSEHQLRENANELKVLLGRERSHFFVFPDILLAQILSTAREKWLRTQRGTGELWTDIVEGSNQPQLGPALGIDLEVGSHRQRTVGWKSMSRLHTSPLLCCCLLWGPQATCGYFNLSYII